MNELLLYRASEISRIEQLAIAKGISSEVLMEEAGKRIFVELRKRWPQAKKLAVVCGSGNNGGDGYVVARLAKQAKLGVKILRLVSDRDLTYETKKSAIRCRKLKINLKEFHDEELEDCDLIVDAIFGTGLRGLMETKFVQAIEAINRRQIPVIAVDLPSGVNAETGAVLQEAVHAAVTVTFIGKKLGLYLGAARDYVGEIVLDDLELPQTLFEASVPELKLLELATELKQLPKRKLTANKGDFGHLLIVGGDYGMGGAVRLAAEGALRAGAGLVSVATRVEHVSSINAGRPEAMVYGIKSVSQLKPLLARATVILLGPGLGLGVWGKALFKAVIQTTKPIVLDGDGLNWLSSYPTVRNNWVLTPHAKEAARLLGVEVAEVETDRLGTLQQLVAKYGGVGLLKGSGSLVADTKTKVLCNVGNPGMAVGGMGDLLGGIIGGLAAQQLTLFAAAKLGCMVHGTAGDLVADQIGEVGMVTSDLLPWVSKLLVHKLN